MKYKVTKGPEVACNTEVDTKSIAPVWLPVYANHMMNQISMAESMNAL